MTAMMIEMICFRLRQKLVFETKKSVHNQQINTEFIMVLTYYTQGRLLLCAQRNAHARTHINKETKERAKREECTGLFHRSLCVIQLRVWARPDAYDQTKHALEFGVETYKFFTDYFGIPDTVPKAGEK